MQVAAQAAQVKATTTTAKPRNTTVAKNIRDAFEASEFSNLVVPADRLERAPETALTDGHEPATHA